jgi:riboflavin synthase
LFTGIVEEVGTIEAAGARMKVKCRTVLADTKEGSSLAVNGVCLTAAKVEPDGFWCDLSPETLARTNLGAL